MEDLKKHYTEIESMIGFYYRLQAHDPNHKYLKCLDSNVLCFFKHIKFQYKNYLNHIKFPEDREADRKGIERVLKYHLEDIGVIPNKRINPIKTLDEYVFILEQELPF